MEFVFDAFSPSPHSIGTHEEDFAGSKGLGSKQWHTALLTGGCLVDGQYLDTRFGSSHGAVPLETWQIHPNIDVILGRIGEFGKQASSARFGQFHPHGIASSDAIGIGRVKDHGHQRF
jgi:hypothetical protein